MGHHHHDHHHHDGHSDTPGRLGIALALTAAFMGVEAVTGWLTGSLALMADAGHMLSDTSALAVALVAAQLARRPPDDRRTMGWRRAEVLGATLNASLLLVIAVFIVIEGTERLQHPREIVAVPMLAVAALGLVLNLANLWLLARGDRDNVNLKAALWHVAGDALGSVGAMVAAGLILAFGWTVADAVVSLLIASIISFGAIRVLRETAEVLMQSAPHGVRPDQVREALLTEPGVREVHHLHLWSMAPGSNVLSVHVVLDDEFEGSEVRARLDGRIRDLVELDHLTIQVELAEECCIHGHRASRAEA